MTRSLLTIYWALLIMLLISTFYFISVLLHLPVAFTASAIVVTSIGTGYFFLLQYKQYADKLLPEKSQ